MILNGRIFGGSDDINSLSNHSYLFQLTQKNFKLCKLKICRENKHNTFIPMLDIINKKQKR